LSASSSGSGFSRREFLLAGAAGLAVSAGSAAPTAQGAARPRPPNILWLVSEDNAPFIGAYGDKLAHTPVIDGLAKRGLLYLNAYANAPVCGVSRFGILTGVYAESCGPAEHFRAKARHPPALQGYPMYLRRAGYYCTNNAKTDYQSDIDPCSLWDENSTRAHWRNRTADAPFMAVFNFGSTHASTAEHLTPGRVKPADVRVPAYLPDTPDVRADLSSYYNRMEIMDGELGERLAELEADGLAKDTIVFYYSDHGGGPMPRAKRFCYQEGLRVPLIVVVPPKYAHLASAPMGSTIDSIVTFIDLAPTVLALAGIEKPPQMAGAAFLGVDRRSDAHYAFGARNRLNENIDFTRTVTDGRFRYLRNYMPNRVLGEHDGMAWNVRSWQDYERNYLARKLNPAQARFFEPKPYEELYDLVSDPDEVRNLADAPEHLARLNELRAALDSHIVEVNDNGFIPEGSALEGYEASRVPGAYPLRRVMDIAAAAARRDATQIPVFQKGLTDANEVVRYWSAQGLLMLGEKAREAREVLRSGIKDPSSAARIVVAEALAGLGETRVGIPVLVSLLDMSPSMAVKLQALNALRGLPPHSIEAALPSLERWGNLQLKDVQFQEDYFTVYSLARYLIARTRGYYKPGYITVSMDWLQGELNQAGAKAKSPLLGTVCGQ
jgi:arylsulfatase A-like enzyme